MLVELCLISRTLLKFEGKFLLLDLAAIALCLHFIEFVWVTSFSCPDARVVPGGRPVLAGS